MTADFIKRSFKKNVPDVGFNSGTSRFTQFGSFQTKAKTDDPYEAPDLEVLQMTTRGYNTSRKNEDFPGHHNFKNETNKESRRYRNESSKQSEATRSGWNEKPGISEIIEVYDSTDKLRIAGVSHDFNIFKLQPTEFHVAIKKLPKAPAVKLPSFDYAKSLISDYAASLQTSQRKQKETTIAKRQEELKLLKSIKKNDSVDLKISKAKARRAGNTATLVSHLDRKREPLKVLREKPAIQALPRFADSTENSDLGPGVYYRPTPWITTTYNLKFFNPA